MKKETWAIYYEAINKVVDYININLYNNRLTTKHLASMVCLSEYHFHRIFKSIIGESVGTYIIRLRLENIAQRLYTGSQSLTEIASQTTYQSKYALSKEFKKHFGVNPSSFRSNKQYFKLQFNYTGELCPIITHIADKTVVYIRIIGIYGEESAYHKAWQKLYCFAKVNNLLNNKTEPLGISFDDPSISDKHSRFYACVTVNKNIEPHGEFGLKTIIGGLYAIFTLKGSYSGLNDLYSAIYYKWMPDSGYKFRKGIFYEKYLNNPDKVNENDILTEVYIPIQLNNI